MLGLVFRRETEQYMLSQTVFNNRAYLKNPQKGFFFIICASTFYDATRLTYETHLITPK